MLTFRDSSCFGAGHRHTTVTTPIPANIKTKTAPHIAGIAIMMHTENDNNNE